jgi:tRNA nucleotidyltransferase/poly(A) polymerase
MPQWLHPAASAYLVGGCVRDLLLGRPPIDYDIVFLGDAPAYARRIASALNGRVVELGRPAFRVWRVASERGLIDVAPAAGESLEEDLRRRDFTVNAMAIGTATGQVVDVTGGCEDLDAGVIRMVSATAFRADPVRLLRAFRFAAQLGFKVDPETQAAIGRDRDLIGQAAGERIREELFKLLAAPDAHPHVLAMRKTGLLEAIFPQMAPGAGESALRSVLALEHILSGFAACPAALVAPLSEEFQDRRKVLLKFAALLRTIALPRQAEAIDRLRLSKRDATRLQSLLRAPSPPGVSACPTGAISTDALRFFQAAGDSAPDVLIQAMADCMAEAAAPGELPEKAGAIHFRLLQDYFFRYRPRSAAPPPVTGSDLIREFGLNPSPLFKKILDKVAERRLAQEGFTRAEAFDLIRTYLGNRS